MNPLRALFDWLCSWALADDLDKPNRRSSKSVHQ